MKYLIMSIFCLFTVSSYADVVVVYDKETKEVKSVSPKQDTVLEATDEQVILKEEWPIDLTYEPKFYKLDGKKLKVNTIKLQEQQEQDEAETKQLTEILAIDNEARYLACESLKGKGINLTQVSCSLFEHK